MRNMRNLAPSPPPWILEKAYPLLMNCLKRSKETKPRCIHGMYGMSGMHGMHAMCGMV